MNLIKPTINAYGNFSDFIVFVDESGDHGLENIDPHYPIFVLAFCIFRKADYIERVYPAVQRFKFKHWGHDGVVLHEHDIRKPRGAFSFMQIPQRREEFLSDLSVLMEAAPFTLLAAVIRKADLNRQYKLPDNPYSMALGFGLERIDKHLESLGQAGRLTHIIVECRGKREDSDLELEFRRICDGVNFSGRRLSFEMVLTPKEANSVGMQLADLVARPIGIKTLRPDQPNQFP